MVRYFKESFRLKNLINLRKEPFYKVFIYYLFLTFVAVLPLTFLIIQEGGQRLDFIQEDFKNPPEEWLLPENCSVEYNEFVCSSEQSYVLYHLGIKYVFNHSGEIETTEKSILFRKTELVYTDGKGAMMSGNYKKFPLVYRFSELNNVRGTEEFASEYQKFAEYIEGSFSRWIVLNSLLQTLAINFLISIVFVLLLALILQIFKIGYQDFMSFFESIKFIMLSTGLPAVISGIIGIFLPAISTVIYNLGLSLIVMLIIVRQGKKEFNLKKEI
ncbi:MAG: DUF1189 family protein [Acholeplasmataceae bacterium]|jgi:maltodextrin utilization protein YvdJ|nr:DUF1189 family protein [Acholeplasmataceae bacterium]